LGVERVARSAPWLAGDVRVGWGEKKREKGVSCGSGTQSVRDAARRFLVSCRKPSDSQALVWNKREKKREGD